MPSRFARIALFSVFGGLAGCSATGEGGGGGSFGNLLAFGGAAPPPVAAGAPDEVDCPAVSVTDGGAATRSGGGQLAVATLARECSGRPDGSIVVKVGVQGRALLGPGSNSGRFDAPFSIALKRGDQILDRRTRRVSVAIPAGQADQPFVVIEEGLIVPPGTGEFDIEVGFGAGPAAATARRRRRG